MEQPSPARALERLTWPDVAPARRETLVLPLGSTEQHGPHLPLATDSLIAQAVASAVVAQYGDAVLAPTISIGASGEHAGFPGTLSVGTDALYSYLLEVVRDAVPAWARVMIVNGHGGNGPAVARLEQTCAYEKRSVVVHHCHVPGGDAHAGLTETSLMLHLHPDLVRRDAIAPGETRPVTDLLPAMRTGGVRAVSANGILGDPTGATAGHGAALFADLIRAARRTYET